MAQLKSAIKKNPLQAIALGITIVTTCGSIIGLYFVLSIAHTLAPLEKNIAVMASQLETDINKDNTEHPTFVTKDEFTQVVTRIDHISTRVDQIYSIINR